MQTSFQNMAHRIADAERHMVYTLQDMGGLTLDQATDAFLYYRKHRLIKLDVALGRYNVKHGAFLDRDVIRRAAKV